MSLKLQAIGPIPEATVKVAKAAFPKGNIYMTMRDELGVFFSDEQFIDLYSSRGQPALSPWRLALVTIMQYAENLTDRQAADAVRGRIDWKYALSLELTDSGFNYSVLSEFRDRLIEGSSEQLLLEKMLSCFKEKGLLKAQGQQRTDSTHVLAAIRTLNRLELVAETMIHTLNVLATTVPDWLKGWVDSEWYHRYEKRIDEYRLPQDDKERQALAETIGIDGHLLLQMIYSELSLEWLPSIPAVEAMRQVWVQQYYIESGKVHWRSKGSIPPSSVMISSPHDVESRMSSNHKTTWNGYKVHLTETCDADTTHLITSVTTTASTEPDNNALEQIHLSLEEKELLPKEHFLDAGYPSTDLLVDSRVKYGIELVCPVRPDNSWQARTDGAFDISCFSIDWENQKVICPQGKTSSQWKKAKRNQQDKIMVRFHKNDCQHCSKRTLCTKSQNGRELTFSPKEKYIALQAVRQMQHTEEFKERYNTRAGVEGTISQAVYALGMRQCRYCGLAKTHLQHVLTACAINLKRVVDWVEGKPRAQTRNFPFAALAA